MTVNSPLICDETELISTLSGLSKELTRIINVLKPIAKTLEKFDDTSVINRQDYVADAVSALKSLDLTFLGHGEIQAEILRHFEKKLTALRANARQKLMQGLALATGGTDPVILSDNPLTLYLHPLTLTVNFELANAEFSYAREAIQTTSLDPKDILDTKQLLVDNFKKLRVESKTFFKRLLTAYKICLLKSDQQPGERIPIVDVLEPLSWIWNEQQTKKSAKFLLPKYILAYQIQKLRNDKLLECQGERINLGTATGGSTKNKNNVIFIPHAQNEGQYYLTLCFNRT